MKIFSRFKSKTKTKPKPIGELLILYGTQSGNAKLVAKQAKQFLEKQGLNPDCRDMHGVNPEALLGVRNLLVVVSTHGEGDPPPTAQKFFDACLSETMVKLPQLNYTLCALGSSAYDAFCEAGKVLDRRLTGLGAQALLPRVDCDDDFSGNAIQWIKQATAALTSGINDNGEVDDTSFETQQTYAAKIVKREALTQVGSVAPVYHLVLNLSPPDFQYGVGDAVEIRPQNPAWLVDAICNKVLKNGGKEQESAMVREKLTRELEITSLSKRTVETYASLSKNEALEELSQSSGKFYDYLGKANVLDLIKDFPSGIDAPAVLDILPKLRGRKYSIASSQKAVPNELHLTVKTIRFPFQGSMHEGAGSVYANELLQPNHNLDIKICPNAMFQMPKTAHTPVIMIGVSTGIAPFRAMLQERQAMGIKGNTWMIWGNKYQAKDYLYKRELQAFKDNGTLERIDTAFSRDEGVGFKYVQDILRAKNQELLQWLGEGAHVYVCGSIKMGASVKATIEEIALETRHAPNSLIQEERWHEDVY